MRSTGRFDGSPDDLYGIFAYIISDINFSCEWTGPRWRWGPRGPKIKTVNTTMKVHIILIITINEDCLDVRRHTAAPLSAVATHHNTFWITMKLRSIVAIMRRTIMMMRSKWWEIVCLVITANFLLRHCGKWPKHFLFKSIFPWPQKDISVQIDLYFLGRRCNRREGRRIGFQSTNNWKLWSAATEF